MPDFDLSGELSLKIELHMLRPITEKVHSGNGPVSLVQLPDVIFLVNISHIDPQTLALCFNMATPWGPKFD